MNRFDLQALWEGFFPRSSPAGNPGRKVYVYVCLSTLLLHSMKMAKILTEGISLVF